MTHPKEPFTVVVTGGHGLVGKALQTFAPEFTYLSRKHADLRDKNAVLALFEKLKPDVVIHLASHVGGVYDNMKHNYTYLVDNTQMHLNILEACRVHHVSKLVNILSTCIFPDEGVQYPLTSDQLHQGPPHPSNCGYAYSKRFLHTASTILSQSSNGTLRVINLIPTNLYGRYDQYDLGRAHVIPALIHKTYLAQKHDTPSLAIRGAGNARRQFLFADDLAKVIAHFVAHEIDHDVACIVSPPENHEISIKDLVHEIVHVFGWDTRRILFDVDEDEGQFCKTTDDMELKTYLPDFEFTSLKEGLGDIIPFFCREYNCLRT
jgi:GDP-L-fucose synthase